MAFIIVPMIRRDFDFFGRQRDLFTDWLKFFDDEWREISLDESRNRFEQELDRIKNEMFRMDIQPIKLDIEEPFVTDPEGNRKLSLRFDCSKFKPEEIEIKAIDNHLTVHAKHVEESENRKIHKEFTREYTLPDNVDPKQLKSHLTSDGVLYIEAPAPEAVEAPKEHLIPIERLEATDSKENEEKGEEKDSEDKPEEKESEEKVEEKEGEDKVEEKESEKADEEKEDAKPEEEPAES